jgi:hypothetical protein
MNDGEVLTLEVLAGYYVRLLNICEAQGARINALEVELTGRSPNILGPAPWTIH